MTVPSDIQVIMLHDVFDSSKDLDFPKRQKLRSFMTTTELEFLLDYLMERFEIATLNDLDKPYIRPRVVLTFDDGMKCSAFFCRSRNHQREESHCL